MLFALLVIVVFGGFALLICTTVSDKAPQALPFTDTASVAQPPLPAAAPEPAKETGPQAEAIVPPPDAASLAAPPAPAIATQCASAWDPLIMRLVAEGLEKDYVQAAFDALNSPPLPEFMAQKAVELYGGKASLAVSETDKVKFAPPDYSHIAGGMTVAAGRRVMNDNAKFFTGLHARYGVPAPFIIAVLMVETGIGAETGRQSALLALGSMAMTNGLQDVLPVITGISGNTESLDEKLKARSEWAYAELKALLAYAKASGKDPSAIPGSVYGAIGMCQFMPSNIPLFGASASAKRAVPDVFILQDAATSVARYLSAHGWKKAQTPKAQIAVLRSYNHSDIYASTVYGVATSIMAPTTHRSAQSARKGGNAVKAARENARASIPSKSKNAKPMKDLPNYSKLLE